MSLDKLNSGATTNGFRPHKLLKEKAVALHDAHYPAPPDMRAPHGWALNIKDKEEEEADDYGVFLRYRRR